MRIRKNVYITETDFGAVLHRVQRVEVFVVAGDEIEWSMQRAPTHRVLGELRGHRAASSFAAVIIRCQERFDVADSETEVGRSPACRLEFRNPFLYAVKAAVNVANRDYESRLVPG